MHKNLDALLTPFIDELLYSWFGRFKKKDPRTGILWTIRIALLGLIADLPARCKLCGTLQHKSVHACMKCNFKGTSKTNPTGGPPLVDWYTPPGDAAILHKMSRKQEDVYEAAEQWDSAMTKTGMRGSAIHRLPYWNLVIQAATESMHLLGCGEGPKTYNKYVDVI